MSIYPKKSYPITVGLSEFEILKASHKFLREEANVDHHDNDRADGTEPSTSTNVGQKRWEDQLAEKYYESLYREFGVCDLKHYKSGNFALRWRTESEVISGAGESTCGNTRCKYHFNSTQGNDFGRKGKRRKEPRLTTLELPFGYIEHGEAKSALVKVVLCARCVKKLMWKRRKEKEEKEMRERGVDLGTLSGNGGVSDESEDEDEEDETEKTDRKGKGKEREKEKEREKLNRTRTREGDEDLQRLSADAVDVEGRSSRKDDIRNGRDSHSEEPMWSTRDSRFRRRSSRSRSPRQHHLNSHSHSRHRSNRDHGRNV